MDWIQGQEHDSFSVGGTPNWENRTLPGGSPIPDNFFEFVGAERTIYQVV